MKYVAAICASGAVLFFWAIATALIGLRHGGGYLGMAIMWMMAIAVWTAVLAFFDHRRVNAKQMPSRGGFRTTESQSTEECPSASPDDDMYRQAYDELEGNSERDKAAWARALSEENGDEGRTRAKYIRLRVASLVKEAQAQRDTARQHELAEKEQYLRKYSGYFVQYTDQRGEAFCLGCRSAGPKSKMLCWKEHGVYCHMDCIDRLPAWAKGAVVAQPAEPLGDPKRTLVGIVGGLPVFEEKNSSET